MTTLPRAIRVLAFTCAAFTSAAADDAEPSLQIRLNTVGYPCAAPKVAAISSACQRVSVEDVATSRVLWQGNALPWSPPGESAPVLWLADFSELRTPGRYRLVVDGVGTSPQFEVAADAYNHTFLTVMQGMYLWRCGTAVAGAPPHEKFCHAACHLDDGLLDQTSDDASHQCRDATGGWHDAGDYNKYVVNGAFTVGMMLHAWLDFEDRIASLNMSYTEDDPQLPDYLEEIKWELDWLLKMQADDGRVYHKLSTLEFGAFAPPEDERTPRYYSPWGSAATADFVAALALASRTYRPFNNQFAQRCLAAAELSHQFLQEHPQRHPADLRAFRTGGYDSDDNDERLWADAEMWAATGDEALMRCLEERLSHLRKHGQATKDSLPVIWDWGNVANLGVFTYLRSDDSRRDPKLVAKLRGDVINAADRIVNQAERSSYGRPLGDRYFWGCNGTIARQTLHLELAFQLSGRQSYRDAKLYALDYLLGCNPHGRSFVTGVGHDPPRFPHDRRSGADNVDAPWPGYLVGGGWPTAMDWKDEQADYRTNEIAINWNGALIYALAGLVDPDGR